jgi:hypothetical protein
MKFNSQKHHRRSIRRKGYDYTWDEMRPDKIYKVKIKISGFTKTQVEEGLPYLIDEIESRPWIFDSQAFWDNLENKVVINIGYEFEERVEHGTFDKISDCVIATMHFDEKIEFDVNRI